MNPDFNDDDYILGRIVDDIEKCANLPADDRLGIKGNTLAIDIVAMLGYLDDAVIEGNEMLESIRGLALDLDRDSNQLEVWNALFRVSRPLINRFHPG